MGRYERMRQSLASDRGIGLLVLFVVLGAVIADRLRIEDGFDPRRADLNDAEFAKKSPLLHEFGIEAETSGFSECGANFKELRSGGYQHGRFESTGGPQVTPS